MDIIISNLSDKPLYLQIEEQIKEAILRGELRDGELMPSVRALASDLGVSVLTTRRVYDDLEREGFAVSQAGRGTFVTAGNPSLMREQRRRLVEADLARAVRSAKMYGVAKEELHMMTDILFEVDN